ncbi:MAG: hypothetical protein WHT46_00925 [Candidatus Geothermincolales bacterium]
MEPRLEFCQRCGVPLYISREHEWLDSGAIVQSHSPTVRPYFIECDGFDAIWNKLEYISGMPLEREIIEGKRRNVKIYLLRHFPDRVRKALEKREIDWQPLNHGLRLIARLAGYGRYEVVSYRNQGEEDDYITETVLYPASRPLACGNMAAAFEILFGRDLDVTYRVLDEDLLEITAFPFPGKRTEETSGRMYFYRPGGVDHERCTECGAPSELARFRWETEVGVVVDRNTGVRMAIMGPEMENIFRDLVDRHGKEFERYIVEATRAYSASAFRHLTGDPERLRMELAIRGLGEVMEFELYRGGAYLKIGQAGLPYLVVGAAQGFFEFLRGYETTVDWEFEDDGSLEIEIKPKSLVL